MFLVFAQIIMLLFVKKAFLKIKIVFFRLSSSLIVLLFWREIVRSFYISKTLEVYLISRRTSIPLDYWTHGSCINMSTSFSSNKAPKIIFIS